MSYGIKLHISGDYEVRLNVIGSQISGDDS
jgi:hypothetical protein